MRLKEFLLYENFIITTKLSVDEVLKRVNDNVQPKQGFNISLFGKNYSKPYTGQIIGTRFTMTRNINYRNSFLPKISGQITSFLGQTEVKVSMKLYTVVLIFISFWLGTVGIICLAILIGGLFGSKEILRNGFSPALLIPFGMFAFGYLLTYFGFKTESKKSKKFLNTILENIENK